MDGGGRLQLQLRPHAQPVLLPHLITGDTKYVAPMECQYKIYSKWRQVTPESGIKAVDRGDMAWQLRNLAQLAYIQKLGGTVWKLICRCA